MSEPRRWSLETARELLVEVRARTAKAVDAVEELDARRQELAAATPERVEADRKLRERISRWVGEMEALGVEVKGLWLVDFDNGSGYYCWRWPEQELEHFHGYQEGYEARVRIQ